MQIYVLRGNDQVGPLTEAEVRTQLASGTITSDTLVWWDGQAEWKPLAQTSLGAASPLPVVKPLAAAPAPVAAAMPLGAGAIATQQRTSGLAITSLVLGIFGFLFAIILAPAAIITGHMARGQIRRDPALKGDGMALAGLILGYFWVGLAVISVIAISVLIALGNQVKSVFSTITSQLSVDQGMTNNAPATPGQ